MLRTRLNAVASCVKSADEVNSGSTSSLRRAMSGLQGVDLAVRDRAHVARVEAALLEDVADALEQERPQRRRPVAVQIDDLPQRDGASRSPSAPADRRAP